MNFRHLSLAVLAASTLLLAACSKEEAAAPAVATVAPAQAYDAVAARAKGFTVGALMGANPVYVLFDPQCPHCSQLWKASEPLHTKVKFIWVPVAIYFLATGAVWQGAVLTAFGIGVIGLVDNVLRPILVGKDTKLPDYVILLSTLGGMALFGKVNTAVARLLSRWRHSPSSATGSRLAIFAMPR